MQQRISIWKDANKSAVRLNSKISDKKQLPSKFAPSRDLSRQSDKLFERSISLDQTLHNKTRQDDTGIMGKTIKLSSVTKPNEDIEKKTSTMYGLPTNLNLRKPDTTHEESENKKSIAIVAELRKEYLTFKKNILLELDRQKQMVQKLVKEIILTMQYELSKITNSAVSKIQEKQSVKTDLSVGCKGLEDWKQKLKDISIVPDIKKQFSVLKFKQKSLTNNKIETNTFKDSIAPPNPLENFNTYLQNISRLRKNIDSMDQLLQGACISYQRAKI